MVKEIQKNISQKEEELKNKIEKEFFVVEEIMKNGNIQLQNWSKNEKEDKAVPMQQLKKFTLIN